MVKGKRRRAGWAAVLLACLVGTTACVSGGSEEPGVDGPECYANADCQAGRECSGGICIGFHGCGGGATCRNNEDCIDGVCRLPCERSTDCEDRGLICGTKDTQHCKPAPNPTPPQAETMSGTGGSAPAPTGGAASAGGMASAGSGATGGLPVGAAGTTATGAGGASAGGTGGTMTGSGGTPTSGFGSFPGAGTASSLAGTSNAG